MSGCAHYTSKPLVPTQTAAALESRSLADPALRTFMEANLRHPLPEWPLKSWDLQSLTLVAFYYSPALDVARAHWEAANAAAITAGARPNPTLSLVPDYSTNPPNGVSVWMPSIALDIPIETAGKRTRRIAIAQQRAEAARWNVITTAWQVRRTLTEAVLDYAAARERERLLARALEAQDLFVRLQEGERAAGAIAESEIAVARIQLAKTRLDFEATRAQVTEARSRCADALSVPLRALDEAQLNYRFEVVDASALTSEEARRRALQGRSDIIAALAEYEATQAALQLEVAKQYPDVHLGPGYAWTEGENMWSLGITVELPVLNQNQGPIAEARAHRTEAAADFLALQAKVIHEVDAAVAALKLAEDASAAAERLLAAQRQSLQAIEAQRKAGAVGALEVTSAQIDAITAESLAFEASVRRQKAVRALEDAVQRALGGDADAEAVVLQIEATQRSPR